MPLPACLPCCCAGQPALCPPRSGTAFVCTAVQGGSTMFKDFGRRVQRDMKRLVDARTPATAQPVEVNVITHPTQSFAVWFGGSVLGMMPEFQQACHTKAEYDEHGPSICRTNAVFRHI